MPLNSRPPSLARYASYLSVQVAKAASRVLGEGLADHDLRLSHFAVLAALSDLGPQCQQDLCDVLDLDKSHMVGFVEDLEQRGLLDRDRDPEDRRRYRVRVTPAGEATLADLYAVEATCQEVVFSTLSEAERGVLVDLLGRVVADADARRLEAGDGAPPAEGPRAPAAAGSGR